MYYSHLLPVASLAYIVVAGQCSSHSSHCAPGGNFDLKGWELQLPIGTQGDPDTIPNSKLEGCHGYQDKPYFYTGDDGAMVMYVPATVSATAVDTSAHGTIIGQIHVDGSVSQYPVAKLYYASTGDLYFGVVDSLKTGNTVYTKVGHVPLKTKFRYEIRYEKNVLSVGIDGGDQQVFANTLGAPISYFKAGNYNQGETPSTIQFYAVQVLH
ncbi:hypothetical protein NQ176_g1010 [Zarea fungicola]|uniref:Uncharacterized protein n=1 Tax=Zarea fungicola TaxID=93591 RepID=A0ACC1NVW2_9HYPO|nr:hypothetical protein NQ176_g1010 [Lecanicillium fungicola]